MKQLLFSKALLSAATLMVGALAFTACSNEDYDGDTNPTYDGESVKTQFAINIPAAKGTRMSADNTQNNNNFLGMYNIKLVPMTGDASSTSTFTSILNLGAIGTGDIAYDGNKNSKIYDNVNVPVGTTNFLFYGVGGTDAPTSDAERFAEGVINSSMLTSSVNDIKFNLQGAKISDEANESQNILKVLNAVANVDSWKDQAEKTTLGDLYKNFISLEAGSANSVCQFLENLYNSVDELANGTDGTTKTIAQNIQSAIKTDNYFNVSDASPYELTTSLTYPRNINMPDGAAILSWNDSEFLYNTANPTIGTNLGVKMEDICFPAPICYFVNTTLKSNNEVPETWPSSLNDWNSGFIDWGSSVTTSTRAIALTSPIQYGVAGLKLTVKCEGSLLEDSKGSNISVPADGFTVTGVLIGGQPTAAGWNFNPKTDAKFTNVVYDKAVNGTVAAKADVAEGTNYTLVLDNKQTDVATVNIAIEFENTSKSDFYGVDGIIPAGSKFYMVAQLNPNSDTGVTNPGSVVSPYVFMQDYTTTANFRITSLKKAYNVIPDLRATEMQLGLAVDLSWQTGLSFDVEIGEN